MINELAINKPDIYSEENIPNQSVCLKANVLCRIDTENVTELIKVLMRYTHDPCDNLDLDKSVESSKVMMGGTICPRKRVLFVYKSKVFVTYGRYIFGYDKLYVNINRKNTVSDPSGNNSDPEKRLDDKITNDHIVLSAPVYDKKCDEYVYSFMIYDKNTNVVDAFGLYR